MAAAKTNGNTTANPIEEATKKVTELNEEATQKVTALAEETTKKLTALNEEATQKLAAFAEQTSQQLTELTEQAKATQKQQTPRRHRLLRAGCPGPRGHVREGRDRAEGRAPEHRGCDARDHHGLHRRGAPVRQLTRRSEGRAAVAPFRGHGL